MDVEEEGSGGAKEGRWPVSMAEEIPENIVEVEGLKEDTAAKEVHSILREMSEAGVLEGWSEGGVVSERARERERERVSP